MKSFDSGIEQLLWPEKRGRDAIYMTASGKKVPGRIDVTPAQTFLRVPKGYLPDFLQPLVGPLSTLKPWLQEIDRKSTRLNSSHMSISYAVFCLKKKK